MVVLDRDDPLPGALPDGVDARRLDVTDSAACDAAIERSVNAVCPGEVDTPMPRAGGRSEPLDAGYTIV